MPIGKKIRVYDLARELKQDTKRVMEALRREGADISVPSNSVSAELADKVRSKYFPKAEVAPKRGIKIIKATKKEDEPHVDAADLEPDVIDEVPESVETVTPIVLEPVEEPVKPVRVKKVPAEKTETIEAPRSVTKVLRKKEPIAEVPVVEETPPAIEEPESETGSNGSTAQVHPVAKPAGS